ncbi:MAG TPA: rhomboid family intramembrane serine protease [Mycobacteriales bacterium]
MSSEQYPSTEAAVPAPHCYRHPQRETWVRCTRCDRPICPDCLRPAAVGFQCPQCVAEGRATQRRPTLLYGGRVSRYAGRASTVLIGLNVAAFIVTALTSPIGLMHNSASKVFFDLVLVPNFVALDHEYWRLLGTAFLHFGPLHLVLNMVALAVVGPGLERVFGLWRFLAIYLLSALGGAVAVYLFDNPINSTAGASGAIFGLFGAAVVVLRRMDLDPRSMMLVIALNLIFTFTIPGISKLGHLGGLAVGVIAACVIVYVPAGRRRTLVQGIGLVTMVAVMAGLVVYRTGALQVVTG